MTLAVTPPSSSFPFPSSTIASSKLIVLLFNTIKINFSIWVGGGGLVPFLILPKFWSLYSVFTVPLDRESLWLKQFVPFLDANPRILSILRFGGTIWNWVLFWGFYSSERLHKGRIFPSIEAEKVDFLWQFEIVELH